MNAYLDEIESPVGPIALAMDETGALIGLRFRESRHPAILENGLMREGFSLLRDEARTAAARGQLAAYFAGERRSFGLPVARGGSDFQEAVWAELSRIPFGETRTYGQVSESIEGTGNAREVGAACAANPVLLVVPCHRVVGADGMPLKARLLDFEEESQKSLFA